MLCVRDLQASYGVSQVLFRVDLDVKAGECVTLLGRNGMGKTTTIKSIMGILRPSGGSIGSGALDLRGRPPHEIARQGFGLVPEGRQVFTNLTVKENLIATAAVSETAVEPWTLDRVYDLFPRLRERERNLAANLSGGEQQMLAIGRALLTNPRLLILDEAMEGLSPVIRTEIWNCLHDLKARGLSLLIIDKNIGPMLRLADRHYIISKGTTVWSGTSSELRCSETIIREHLGV